MTVTCRLWDRLLQTLVGFIFFNKLWTIFFLDDWTVTVILTSLYLHFLWLSEEMTAPELEPVPIVEKPVRSRGKTPVTVRTSSRRHNKVRRMLAPLNHLSSWIRFQVRHCNSVYVHRWKKIKQLVTRLLRRVKMLLKRYWLMRSTHLRASGESGLCRLYAFGDQ